MQVAAVRRGGRIFVDSLRMKAGGEGEGEEGGSGGRGDRTMPVYVCEYARVHVW